MSLKFSKKYVLLDKNAYESVKHKKELEPLSTNPDLVLAEKTRDSIHANLRDPTTDVYSQLERHAYNMRKFLKELDSSRRPQRELYNQINGVSSGIDEMREWRRELAQRRVEEEREKGDVERRDRTLKHGLQQRRPSEEDPRSKHKDASVFRARRENQFRSQASFLDKNLVRSPIATRSRREGSGRRLDRVIPQHSQRSRREERKSSHPSGDEGQRWATT